MMDPVSISSLLLAEEEKIRGELHADALIDKNRRQSVDRLTDLFSRILLKYNAANTDDRTRQSVADGLTAAAQSMLDLLLAANAKREIEKRRVRVGAVIGLLLALICGLASALVFRTYYAVGCAFMAGAAVCTFIAGRLWYGEREVRVRTELDPELIWKTLKKAAETMDRKTEEYLAQEKAWAQETETQETAFVSGQLSQEELQLFGDLLEALYSGNGDFALRQLRKLLPYLRAHGITILDYEKEYSELFEMLPTKKQSATQRPALLRGDQLLLVGRATELAESSRR